MLSQSVALVKENPGYQSDSQATEIEIVIADRNTDTSSLASSSSPVCRQMISVISPVQGRTPPFQDLHSRSCRTWKLSHISMSMFRIYWICSQKMSTGIRITSIPTNEFIRGGYFQKWIQVTFSTSFPKCEICHFHYKRGTTCDVSVAPCIEYSWLSRFS